MPRPPLFALSRNRKSKLQRDRCGLMVMCLIRPEKGRGKLRRIRVFWGPFGRNGQMSIVMKNLVGTLALFLLPSLPPTSTAYFYILLLLLYACGVMPSKFIGSCLRGFCLVLISCSEEIMGLCVHGALCRLLRHSWQHKALWPCGRGSSLLLGNALAGIAGQWRFEGFSECSTVNGNTVETHQYHTRHRNDVFRL